jgi:hypothetical protein
MSKMVAASRYSAVCQPNEAMKAWPSGANTNCPMEDAAVAMPNDHERLSGGTSLANAAMMMENEVMAMPRPISTPPDRYIIGPVPALTISAVPAA